MTQSEIFVMHLLAFKNVEAIIQSQTMETTERLVCIKQATIYIYIKMLQMTHNWDTGNKGVERVLLWRGKNNNLINKTTKGGLCGVIWR